MKQRTYLLLCGTIFLVVAVLHLSRLILGWDVTVAGWLAPHWISVPGLLIPGMLAVWGFNLASRSRAA